METTAIDSGVASIGGTNGSIPLSGHLASPAVNRDQLKIPPHPSGEVVVDAAAPMNTRCDCDSGNFRASDKSDEQRCVVL